MILNEFQRPSLGNAVSNYIRYVTPYTSRGLCYPDSDSDSADVLYGMAEHNLYSIMCMILNTGTPEKTVLENLDNGIWGVDDVLNYIEEKY